MKNYFLKQKTLQKTNIHTGTYRKIDSVNNASIIFIDSFHYIYTSSGCDWIISYL